MRFAVCPFSRKAHIKSDSNECSRRHGVGPKGMVAIKAVVRLNLVDVPNKECDREGTEFSDA
jgi:hypothetical protein